MMQIKRGNALLTEVVPLNNSTVTRAVMGEEKLTLSYECATHIELMIGDTVEHDGGTWTLNELPTVKKLSAHKYQVDATFEIGRYDLSKAMYLLFDSADVPPKGEFSLTGQAALFMDLLVANLNRVAGTTRWSVGDVLADTPYLTLSFSNEDCLTVLGRLADEFDTEYHITGHIVHLERKTTERMVTLQYGSTLYDVERVSVDGKALCTRLYAYGSTKNLPSDYRGGNMPLCLPEATGQYIEQNSAELYGIIEQSKTFEEIYPRLDACGAGVVTAVGTHLQFTDSALDFDVNDFLLAGTTAKVHFNTGQCAGYDFEIKSYNHATHTFTIITNTEENDFTLPTETLKPAVGDKYVLLDVVMPEAYRTAAEAELLAAAQEYLNEYDHPRVEYKCTFSGIVAKQNEQLLECGDTVRLIDRELYIDEQIRIIKLTKGLSKTWELQIDLANSVTRTTLERIEGDIVNVQHEVVESNARINRNTLRGYRQTKELREMVFDTDGYFDAENIKPLSIETSMLSVGAKSQSFQLTTLLQPNYGGNANVLRWSAGVLAHFTINDDQITEWIIPAGSITLTGTNTGTAQYIYARCSRTGSAGVVCLSPDTKKFDSDATDWYFLIGVLHSPIDGVRGISLTYGQTTINGQFITTGVIKSIDGATYFNLNTGEIGGKIKFLGTDGTEKSVSSAFTETTEYIDASVSNAEAEQASKGTQLVVNGTGAMLNNTNFSPLVFNADRYGSGSGSFAYSGKGLNFFCQKLIPVDTNRTYRISFAAKSLNSIHRHFAFYDCLDIDGLSISAKNVLYISNTLTTLSQELKDGDTQIHLTSAAAWKDTTARYERGVILWNYKNSTGYQFEPLTYSRNVYQNIYAASDSVDKSTGVITLSSAWTGGTVAAGTELSQCTDSNNYNYFGLINAAAPSSWTEYSKDVTGEIGGTLNANFFRTGTAFVRFGCLCNYNGIAEADTLLIANVSVQDVTDLLAAQAEVAAEEQARITALQGVNANLAIMQNQIDGEVSNWFYAYTPTTINLPASNWTTDTLRERHVGDTFTNTQTYVDDTTTPDAGKSWRWLKTDVVYGWSQISDSDAVKALQEAAKAQSTADHKSTTFIVQPSNYSEGDMWILAAATTVNGTAYKAGEMLTANSESETFVASHWSKKVSYTDDEVANAAQTTASAAAQSANAAQTAANSAQTAANTANTAISAMNDDGIFDQTEKQTIRTQWEQISGVGNTTGSYSTTKGSCGVAVAAAGTYSVSTTALTNAYTNLRTCLNTLALYTNSNTNFTTAYTRATMADLFAVYYNAETSLWNDIATAITNSAVSNIQIGGVNLCDFKRIFGNTTAYRGTKTVDGYAFTMVATGNDCYTLSYSYLSDLLIAVKPNTEYIFSFKKQNGTSGTAYIFFYSDHDSQYTSLKSFTDTYQEFTTPATCNYIAIRLGITNAGDTEVFSEIKVEQGNKATAWTPSIADTQAEITTAQTTANNAATQAAEAQTAVSDLDDEMNGSFKDGVISASEAKSIGEMLKTLSSEKGDVDNVYTQLYANTYLTGTAKSNLATAKTALNTAYTNLVSTINTIVSAGTVTDANRSTYSSRYTTFNSALATFSTRVEEANAAIQNVLKGYSDTAQTTAEKLIGEEQLCVNSYVGELTIAEGINKTFVSDKALKSNTYYTTVLDVTAPTGGTITLGGYWSGGIIPAGTDGIIALQGKDSRTLSNKTLGITNTGTSAITFRWMCTYEGDVKVPTEWRPSFLTEKPHIYDNLIVDSLTRTVTGASGANYAFLKLMELENGKLYTFSATPSIAASMQVYDFDNESTGGDFGRYDFAANTRGSHTFVVPDDGNTWTLLLYAGVAGATSGLTCTWSKLMLQHYDRASDWKPENNTLALALKGSTEIDGGLVLANLMMLKNASGNVTAGMSGMKDNVTLWGGGTYNQAYNQANNKHDAAGEVPILITGDGNKSKIGVFRVIEDGIGIFGTDSTIILTNQLLEEISVDKTIDISEKDTTDYADSVMVQAADNSASYSYNGRLPITFNAGNVKDGYYHFDFSRKYAYVGLYMYLANAAGANPNEGAELSVVFPASMSITIVNNGIDIYTKRFTISGERTFSLIDDWSTSHDNLDENDEPPTVSYLPTDGVTSEQIYIEKGSISIRIDCVVQVSMYNSKHLKLDAGLSYYNNQTRVNIESYFGVSLNTGNRHIIIAGNGIRVVDSRQNGDFVLKNDGTDLSLSVKGSTDMPGVLMSGRAYATGGGVAMWGKTHDDYTVTRLSNGVYKVWHSIGHTAYSVQVTPEFVSGGGAYIAQAYNFQTDYFYVVIHGLDGAAASKGFSFAAFGNNQA